MFCDNTSAVNWAYKLRMSKSIPEACHFHALGLRIHSSGASSLTPLNIPSNKNKMADVSSCAFKEGTYFEAHTSLLLYFNTLFPLQQEAYWQMMLLLQKLSLQVMSCLLGEPLTMEQLQQLPKRVKKLAPLAKIHLALEQR
eukprot:7217612-Ditylum_brightwellii.AAC.1